MFASSTQCSPSLPEDALLPALFATYLARISPAFGRVCVWIICGGNFANWKVAVPNLPVSHFGLRRVPLNSLPLSLRDPARCSH